MAIVLLKSAELFLAVFGFVSLLRVLFFWLLKTDNPGRFCIFISFQGHDDQAEITLRSAVERSKWLGHRARVFCVDLGMDQETKKICEIVCRENENLVLCTPDELRNSYGDWFANT